MLMTVKRECSSKALVTYGVRLLVMDDWKAFVRYSIHMLSKLLVTPLNTVRANLPCEGTCQRSLRPNQSNGFNVLNTLLCVRVDCCSCLNFANGVILIHIEGAHISLGLMADLSVILSGIDGSHVRCHYPRLYRILCGQSEMEKAISHGSQVPIYSRSHIRYTEQQTVRVRLDIFSSLLGWHPGLG